MKIRSDFFVRVEHGNWYGPNVKKHVLLVILFLLMLPAGPTRGDIAPTQYVGENIAPIDTPGIRMVSAQVDITWDTWDKPWTLSAVFVMENQDIKDKEVTLGFPVSLPNEFLGKDSLGFTISYDKVPADASAITKVDAREDHSNYKDYGYYDQTWYRCRHVFHPGLTTVVVGTKLPGTHIMSSENKILKYCIQSGAAWSGPIGYESVTIHFEYPITQDNKELTFTKEKIFEATPPDYKINGNIIRWVFKNFKPKDHDHDIRVEYWTPN